MFVPLLDRGALGAAIGLFCCCLAAPSTCSAQLPPAQRQALISLSQAAREQLNPQRLPSTQQAQAQVISAVAGVHDYLAPRTDQENLARWMQYINADPLIEAIRSEIAQEETEAQAQRVRGRLIGDIQGLELAPMRQLRESTEQLLAALRFDDPDAAIRLVDDQLQVLARRLEAMDEVPTPEQAATIGAIVRLLYESNQAPAVVQSVRGAFSHPNLILTVSGDLVERAINQNISQTRPVRDCILGTTIIGTAALNGQVVGRLVPSHGRVQIDLIMTGQLNSRTTGYNGPVRLPTVGCGYVTATRSLWIGEQERYLSPTLASATLDSTITSIEHPLRIVRRIAARRIDQQQPQAERIATERFRRQVANDFARQTSQAISGGGQPGGAGRTAAIAQVVDQTRTTLARLNVDEPARELGSTRQSIYVRALQRTESQLSASNPPPPLGRLLVSAPARGTTTQQGSPTVRAPFAAAIQLHESAVDNVAAQILANRTVTGREIDRLIAAAGLPQVGSARNAERDSDNRNSDNQDGGGAASEDGPEAEEPFEIDFAGYRPIILELRDQTVRIGIRGTRFSQGDRELARPLEITAAYEPERTAEGSMILRRSGEIRVAFPGVRRLTLQQIVLRRAIQRIFTDRFPETLLDRPLVVPAIGGGSLGNFRTLRPVVIDARNGWMSVAIN